jgi:hypothetical protein
LVGTLIGLLLYRTSSAFFSETAKTKSGVRAIRLTGSVVIAALAFYGMKISTPSQRLLGQQQGMAQVPESKIEELSNLATALDRSVLEVQACVNTQVDQGCLNKVQLLKNDTSTLTAKVATLKQQ